MNVLPFFLIELYINDRKNISLNKISNKALSNYKKIANSSRVFIELDYSKNGEKLYLLAGGKKKKITKQALEGYVEILNIEMDYSIYDLYNFENLYFRIAMYLSEIKLEDLSNYFNKKGIHKVYKEILENDTNGLFSLPKV